MILSQILRIKLQNKSHNNYKKVTYSQYIQTKKKKNNINKDIIVIKPQVTKIIIYKNRLLYKNKIHFKNQQNNINNTILHNNIYIILTNIIVMNNMITIKNLIKIKMITKSKVKLIEK